MHSNANFFFVLIILSVQCYNHAFVLADQEEAHWAGKWFPHKPNEIESAKTEATFGSSKICDNANYEISLDFDPDNVRDTYMYLCLDTKLKYQPDAKTWPIVTEHIVPPVYTPREVCLNETIDYTESLPTFGPHRPLPAKFGEYKYLPIQRWMHNLKIGSIAMLYHPCANSAEVAKLKTVVHNCLYRHVITPSLLPSPERPLVLLAWGKSLQMSVVDEKTVAEFIRQNALKGPAAFRDGEYDKLLLTEAKLITTLNDENLCAYLE